MKKLILISIAAIICFSFAGISVYCAENKKSVYIYEYKKELALTDTQEQNLRDIIAKAQRYVADKQNNLNRLQAELNKMLAERADLDKIKAIINEIAKIQADFAYERIAGERTIETELTGEQFGKWRSIQAEFVNNLQQAQNAASQAKEIKK
jgi:Spy/CpxP family protein refolding chaperone